MFDNDDDKRKPYTIAEKPVEGSLNIRLTILNHDERDSVDKHWDFSAYLPTWYGDINLYLTPHKKYRTLILDSDYLINKKQAKDYDNNLPKSWINENDSCQVNYRPYRNSSDHFGIKFSEFSVIEDISANQKRNAKRELGHAAVFIQPTLDKIFAAAKQYALDNYGYQLIKLPFETDWCIDNFDDEINDDDNDYFKFRHHKLL